MLHLKPLAWITVAADSRGEAALMSRWAVLGYVGAQALEARTHLPDAGGAVDAHGLLMDTPVARAWSATSFGRSTPR